MAEVVGVACVVDSSLALFSEWQRVMSDYIVPLLQRLYDAGRQLRIAFVCYAPSATQPTPLLCKLNFAPPQILVKDLKDEPFKLGVGQTGSGGGRGMAVLEGLVAAIELIDILKTTTEKSVCHIVHVAASPPDAASHPLWNVSPRLDAITWDTLPQEVQKRDIRYSSILLQPIGKLSAFHLAAAGASAQTPWFPVRSPHSVHLTGYPSPKGVKRPNDPTPSTPDAIPEAKRPRVSSQTRSPKTTAPTPQVPTANATPKITPTITQAPQASSPVQPQPTPSPAMAPASIPPARVNPPPPFTPASFQKAVERLADSEKHLKQKIAEAAAHQHAGRIQEAEAIRQQTQSQFMQYKKMKTFMDQYRVRLQEHQAQQMAAQSGQNSSGPSGGNTAPSTAAAAATALTPTLTSTVESLPNGAAVPAIPTSSPHAGVTAEPPPPPTQGLSKAQDAQLQKLLEQQQRRTPHIGHATIPQTQTSPASVPTAQVQPPAGAIRMQANNKHWEGTLAWRGLEHATHVRTEIQTKVTLTSVPNQELLRPETWPGTLNLTPSKERAISWFLLQEWLKRMNATAFTLQPRDVLGEDKGKNEEHFRALIRLLAEKKIYALSGWSGPDGREQQVMVFPAKGGLAGGFFPNGIPEMPPTQICDIDLESIPAPMAYILTRLPAAQATQLMQLPLERRKQWLTALATQQHQAAQQKQMVAQGQAHPPGSGGNGGAMAMGGNLPGGMDSTGGLGAGVGQMPGVMGAGVDAGGVAGAGHGGVLGMGNMNVGGAAGMHQRTGSGSGSINYEMLQSFMARTGQH